MNGTPMAVLMKLGDWSEMRIVQRYAHLAPSHIHQFASNAKPPDLLHNSLQNETRSKKSA